MSENFEPGCGTDLVIRSLVDEDGLDDVQKRHLAQCPACKRERELLAGRLDRLGSLAGRYTPKPRRLPVLPEGREEREKATLKGLFLNPGLAWGTAAGFVLAVLAGAWMLSHAPGLGVSPEDLAREAARDELFMAEISVLEDDPLHEEFRRILPESSPVLGDEVLDFIIPVDARAGGGESRIWEV
ncbi:MAG: hypothetical protein WAR22_10725 [Desulfomonilia bacterium]|jgi:hypothetical protein